MSEKFLEDMDKLEYDWDILPILIMVASLKDPPRYDGSFKSKLRIRWFQLRLIPFIIWVRFYLWMLERGAKRRFKERHR